MAVLTPRSVFRRYNVDGVPSSGHHKVIKDEVVQLLEQVFGVSRGGWVVSQTLAELTGVTPENETDGGVVLADPDPANNGYYQRDGGVWVRGRGFPDTFARVTLSGSGTAQTGVVEAGVNPADVEVFFAFVETENEGPLTLAIGGEAPREVVNLAGNPLSAGEWTGAVMFALRDGKYQLLLDAGAAASAAQSASDAKDEADRAEEEADRSDAAADRAENSASSFIEVATNFKTVAALLADETMGYAGSGKDVIVGEGDIVTAQGFRYEVLPADATDANIETAGGVRLNRADLFDISVTVGPGGMFSTINMALTYLSGQSRGYEPGGVAAEVKLKSGFVMAEQVHLTGQNLGWVTISAEDPEVPIQRSAITALKATLAYPAFFFDNASAAPQIACLFSMDESGEGAYRIAFLYRNSVGRIREFCGCKNAAYRGLYVTGAATVRASHSIWDGVKSIGDSDGAGCRASDGGFMAIQQCSCRNSAGDGVSVNGSIAHVHKADLSGAARDGLRAEAGSHVSAFELIAEDCGRYALYAEGSFVSAHSSRFDRAGADAVRAADGAVVNVRSSVGIAAGSRGLQALNGSSINARSSDFSGASVGGEARFASQINAQGANLRTTADTDTTNDIRVREGSFISAESATGGYSKAPNLVTADGAIFNTAVASEATIRETVNFTSGTGTLAHGILGIPTFTQATVGQSAAVGVTVSARSATNVTLRAYNLSDGSTYSGNLVIELFARR